MTDYAKLAEKIVEKYHYGFLSAGGKVPVDLALARALLACDQERQEALGRAEEAEAVAVVFERLASEEGVGFKAEAQHYRDALERIMACDYRGNMPPEQTIARDALAGDAK